MKRLAGRCPCGVSLELAAREGDEHLRHEEKKRCTRCGEAKPFDAFFRHRSRGGLLFSRCKVCEAARKRERYNENPLIRARRLAETQRSYVKHKVARLTKRAAYYVEHVEDCRRWQRAYYKANRETLCAAARTYHQQNRDRILAAKRDYDRNRRTTPKRKAA